ncbi:MAG: tRNA 4-thiouridine(8) synthase ThiI [Candidatus Magasanikbacteria bacterium RIFOXYD2_FULL_39_9]|uniref:Probable tRNA sulfurtransferase n=1 Tax=Candidatus Magasanikbacteria bacterium RIFOXYD1_FULL_40_23 TaxID=1798705 RepID=A0A1F6PB01_9BACT|nr:MAG: tRNA 4-thiouridine(8) synthase ThiI [Candidatus Magasanikbacteria bacterium RIFOXYD2_FULL_39_9]OGH93346.1 MAG: tRNA 4-thiouridine(8) synthase ThiI [Candidatus Magasanikbacteria bacterium RIFOXYD1_FULL_40_23]
MLNLIIHIDEIFLKGSNQPIFYKRLMDNLRVLFPKINIKRTEGSLWVENVLPEQLEQLALVPGFANYAIAFKADSSIESIKQAVDELVKSEGNTKTFRISAERSYKKFPSSSLEIEKEIGEYVRVKYGWKVALNNSDLNVHISVGKDDTYIFGNTHNAAGGLPTGSCGKVMALLSGGIDSPVAVYKMMTRGANVDLIHFQNQTTVTEEVSAKIFDLAKILSRYQPGVQLFMVPFAEIQKQIIMKIPAQYRMIVTRRIFNKIADRVARENKCLALVTGDSLGQVASQTLENMSVIYAASSLLKMSPLIGTNKKDIIDTARTIGTLATSIRPYEDCCSLFVAKHPETKAKLDRILKIEESIDQKIIDNVEVILYPISTN